MKSGLSRWELDKYDGGLSSGEKRGIEGAFRNGQGLDYRSNPDRLGANRRLVKDSSTTVDELLLWMVRDGTTTYGYGDSGGIFKRTGAGVWSDEKAVASSHGNGLGIFDDYLYYATDVGLGRYGPLSGTPAFDDDFLKSVDDEVDKFLDTSVANNYVPPTSISETATNKQVWTAGVDNIAGIAIRAGNKGTGDWTVTVHDSSDVVVAQKTIANADLTTNKLFTFRFSGVHDLTIGNNYHFHVTSTVADGQVKCGTASDLNTAVFASLQYFNPDDVDQYDDGIEDTAAITTYALATSIDEAETSKKTFVPEKGTQVGISVVPFVVGTGDWTITVHDEKDQVVATDTISNANLKAYGYNKFDLSWTAVVGATYHFHITSTVADGNVVTTSLNDLEGVGFKSHYQILEDATYHPMEFYPGAGALCIGNGNYLAVYDGIIYRTSGENEGSEKLKFDKAESVRALATVGDRLAIGVWKGNSIGDDGHGRIYLWDGVSPFPRTFKDVPGEINAMETGDDGLLYVWAGGKGQIYVYNGGLTLLRTIPAVGRNKTVEVYPGAVTTWNGLIHFGISGGDSTVVPRGIYELGGIDKNYPNSLNLGYLISTGGSDEDVSIGSVLGVGPGLVLVAWKDDTTYGVDVVDTAQDQQTVTYESLIFDGGTMALDKRGSSVKLNYVELESGQSIKVEYRLDRADLWTELGVANTVGSKMSSLEFTERWTEVELKISLITTGTSAPSLIACTLFFDFDRDEQ